MLPWMLRPFVDDDDGVCGRGAYARSCPGAQVLAVARREGEPLADGRWLFIMWSAHVVQGLHSPFPRRLRR